MASPEDLGFNPWSSRLFFCPLAGYLEAFEAFGTDHQGSKGAESAQPCPPQAARVGCGREHRPRRRTALHPFSPLGNAALPSGAEIAVPLSTTLFPTRTWRSTSRDGGALEIPPLGVSI